MSQTVSALLSLRELILSGALPPGERLSELWVVDRLGISRTPVRAALARLAEEGLLEPLSNGGFAVKSFTTAEIEDAIELRGTLEGLAARFAAERGIAEGQRVRMEECLERLDAVTSPTGVSAADFDTYVDLNAEFHALVVDMAASPVLERQIARVAALPFASPSGFVEAHQVRPEGRLSLAIAQEQHRRIGESIVRREGGRAEALMREHARLARRNLELVLEAGDKLHLVRGGALIRQRTPA